LARPGNREQGGEFDAGENGLGKGIGEEDVIGTGWSDPGRKDKDVLNPS
jgi:hypothetical protein